MNFSKKLDYKNCLTKLKMCSLMSACVLMMAAACSSESPTPTEEPVAPAIPEGNFYISVNVALPGNGTKSTTDPEGNTSSDLTVGATSAENAITEITLYICDGDEVVSKLSPTTSNDNGIWMKANVTSELNKLVAKAGKTLSLLVVANESVAGISGHTLESEGAKGATFKANSFTTPIGDFGENGKNVPLVNAADFPIVIPGSLSQSYEDNLELLLEQFSEKEGSNLTYPIEETLYLERGVARVEYRDHANRGNASLPEESHAYFVGGTSLKVQLEKMKIFNINKEAYLFRHIASGTETKATGNVRPFGDENGNDGSYADFYNWVPSPDWTTSMTLPIERDLMYRPYREGNSFDVEGSLDWTSVVTIDARNVSEEFKNGRGGYHPWCYIMENTLPSVDDMSDVSLFKHATGVAFRFVILGNDNKPLTYSEEYENYPLPFVTNAPGTSGEVICVTLSGGNWMNVEAIDGKYYLTYVAYITHNFDSSADADLSPMQYGVVRNNSYQLSVQSIKNLPFPQEKKTMWLELSVEVKEWVKRKQDLDLGEWELPEEP